MPFRNQDFSDFLKTIEPDCPADDAQAMSITRLISGRYDTQARCAMWGQSGSLRDVTIRVDAETLDVSGDVFDASDKSTRYQLGDRSDWSYSFHGRVVGCRQAPSGRTSLLVRADVDVRPSDMRTSAQHALVLLNIENGSLIEARGVLIAKDKSWLVKSHWETVRVGAPDPLYRRIRIRCASALNPDETEVLKATLLHPQSAFSLSGALELAHVSSLIEFVNLPEGVPGQNCTVEEARDFAIRAGFAEMDDIPAATGDFVEDWDLVLVFCNLDAQDQGTRISGRSFNIQNVAGRMQTRFAGVINLAEIRKMADEVPQGVTFPNGPLNDSIGVAEAWELRQITLHEIGHLLNLPHAWVRHQGHRSLGRSDAGAISTTNYGMDWPHGKVTRCFTEKYMPIEQGPLSRRKRFRQLRKRLSRDVIYDREECRFIRHAPLDQIAQGGRTFRDALWPVPAIGRESAGTPGLEIIGCHQGAAGPELCKVAYLELPFLTVGGYYMRAPLPLAVRSTDYQTPLPSLAYLFAAGVLQIVFQPLKPPISPFLTGWPEARLIDPIYLQSPNWDCRTDRDGVISLPWIREPRAPRGRDFAIQVIWFRTSSEMIRSNVVTVSRGPDLLLNGQQKPFEAASRSRNRRWFEVAAAQRVRLSQQLDDPFIPPAQHELLPAIYFNPRQ